MKPATCHPDKPHLAKGLCKACYSREWAADNPEKVRESRARRLATCHPDRPVLARGLCSTCYRRKWRSDPEHREQERATARASALRRYHENPRRKILSKHGLTPERFDRLLAEQGGTCATCPATTGLQVDHCHTRGNVRAILCRNCNSALGHAKDDPARLRALADYLDHHSSSDASSDASSEPSAS